MTVQQTGTILLLQQQPLSLRIDLAGNRASLYVSKHAEHDLPFIEAQLENAPLAPFAAKILPPYRAQHKAGAARTLPQALTFENGVIHASFPDIGTAAIQVQLYPEFAVFRVLSCPQGIERLYFGGVHCPECGHGLSSVGMALNLHTNSSDLLSTAPSMSAAAFRDFGIEGAAFAAILCREEELRRVMQGVTAEFTEDIPWSPKGGAFAADHEDIRHSYLLNFAGITLDTVDAWIEAAQHFGFSQIDFHGGYSFRFGDFEPHPELYPGGRKEFAAVIDRLHQAGIQAGLHTYAQFLSPESRYVTPIPHPDLGGYPFTLTEAIDTCTATVPVLESTSHISTKTSFFVRNSVLLMIDQEILKFDAVGENEFVICERGALGTTPAPHAAGACVKHLFSVFGLLAADPNSELYLEIAHNTAEMYNEVGFDMIYLDAIDGSDIFAGIDKAWYHAAAFVAEIMRSVKRPPILEMSEMWHHFWYFRSRMGAWDHSFRGHKYHLGEHDRSNLRVRNKTLLPQNYGWWFYGKPDPEMPIQVRREFIDDYEFWAGNSLKNDWSLSFVPGNDWSLSLLPCGTRVLNDEMQRFAEVIRSYEELRLAGYTPDAAFLQSRDSTFLNGRPVPITYRKALISHENRSSSITVSAGERMNRLRIENRPFPAADRNGPVIFSAQHAAETRLLASKNVQASMQVCEDEPAGLLLNAIQSGDFGYARMEYVYKEKLDISTAPGLSIMVCGDGKGEVLDIQIKGQKYLQSGTLDRMITVDFVGWKCFRLIESDAQRLEENYWPFSGGGHYNEPDHAPAYQIAMDTPLSQYEWHPSSMDVDIYFNNRERAKLEDVYSVSVWMNNMKDGESYSVTVGEISAFPIQRQPLTDLRIFIDGKSYPIGGQIPVEAYIEYDNGTWYGYDVDGNLLTDVVYPTLPVIRSGNEIAAEAAGEFGLEFTVGTVEE